MKQEKHEIYFKDKKCETVVDIPEKKDISDLAEMYKHWVLLSDLLQEHDCRRVNVPEFSEILFCYVMDCWRCNNIKCPGIKSTSFDCYNPKTHKTIQVKATSVGEDLTSFGPRSQWDELYLMNFFCDEEYNGSFTIYQIPADKIYNTMVNQNETLAQKQKTGQRPRFSIMKKIIEPDNIKPIGKFNVYDLKKLKEI